MPRKKKTYKLDHQVVSKKIWILYSSNRQFCFLQEIRLGYFGPHHRCGCVHCDPELVLPEPPFMRRPSESGEPHQETPK